MHILNRLKIELKAAVEAGGPSEETFYKEWSEDQRKSYIDEHPNSRFAQKDNSNSETKPKEVKKPEFKERETGKNDWLGKVNITDTGVKVNDKDKDILRSVSGQLSDGIWENSRAMEKYWQNLDFDEKDGNLVIHTKSEGWDNPFRAMDDQKIRDYVAGKIKQIVKIELRDNGMDDKANWNRNNDMKLDYLSRKRDNPITIKDAYKLYDALLGRKPRS